MPKNTKKTSKFKKKTSKFKKKIGNYNKKIKNYFSNENKPWNKAALLLELGINEDYIYNIRHKRIKLTKEHENFLIAWDQADIKIEQEILKEALSTPQAKLEYWKLAYQYPRNKKIDKEELNNTTPVNININLEKPRDLNNE